MIDLLLGVSLLFSSLPFVRGHTPSAGDCGTTSVATVPGCWGVPGCAYVIASDLGPGAACKYDYCNCGGTNVPLLPETISGTSTIGCASYTIQPTKNNCPTTSPATPAPNTAFKTETLTASGHGLITVTLPSGSSITGLTTLITKGSTLTLSPTPLSKSVSKVQTFTKSNGSRITLTLPSGSSITALTTVTTHGSTLTIAPLSTTTESPASSPLAIVIDGSSIPIPSTTTTITEKDGSIVFVGPSGIVESGRTIPIPSEQTTITTDGATYTFAGSKLATGSPHTGYF